MLGTNRDKPCLYLQILLATSLASPANSWPGSEVPHVDSCVKSSNYRINGLIQPGGPHQVLGCKLKRQQNQYSITQHAGIIQVGRLCCSTVKTLNACLPKYTNTHKKITIINVVP